MQRHHPQLVLKLLQLGVQPLQLAMPWIQFGFVTYLEADQARSLYALCFTLYALRFTHYAIRFTLYTHTLFHHD